MNCPDRFLYEYAVVRYVPRVDREEFLNIGLVMMCKRQRWLKGKIGINREKIKAFDCMVDLDRLEHQCKFFERVDVPAKDLPVEECYRWLTAVKNAVIQTSASHPGIICNREENNTDATDILEKEFSRLFDTLVR